tara:strand:+ start:40 stop:621 length:582 start_codon:yes stop_codon:yes gene_type:complete
MSNKFLSTLKKTGTASPTTPADFVNETWSVLNEKTVDDGDTSYTFTPASPLLWSAYDVIQVICELTSNGSNDLRFRANTAENQAYQYAGREILSDGSEVLISATSQTHFLACDQGRVARSSTQIFELRSMSAVKMSIMCSAFAQDINSTGQGNFDNKGWNTHEIDDTVVTIELSCTSSSWKSGNIRFLGRLKK